MTTVVFRIVLHVVIFVATFFPYILVLGGGLAVNLAVGTLLRLIASLVAVGNIAWMINDSKNSWYALPQQNVTQFKLLPRVDVT